MKETATWVERLATWQGLLTTWQEVEKTREAEACLFLRSRAHVAR